MQLIWPTKQMKRRRNNLKPKMPTTRMEKRVREKARPRRRKRRVSTIKYKIKQIYFLILEKKKSGPKEYAPREQDNSHIRLLGSWSPGDWKQTVDYSIPVAQQFPSGKFNEGLWMDYHQDFNTQRSTAAEYRERDRLHETRINDLRKAAECHRQVRKSVQPLMKPGIKLIDLC